MLAPRYVERNNELEKYRERCQALHQRKLETISGGKTRQQLTEFEIVRKLNDAKKRANQFYVNEKRAMIDKENSILLKKLFDISHGKWSSVSHLEEKKGRSLNMNARKVEIERIQKENNDFAKRLFTKGPCMSSKKFEEEFTTHLKYKKQLKKVGQKSRSLQKTQGRSTILPPINKDLSKEGNNDARSDGATMLLTAQKSIASLKAETNFSPKVENIIAKDFSQKVESTEAKDISKKVPDTTVIQEVNKAEDKGAEVKGTEDKNANDELFARAESLLNTSLNKNKLTTENQEITSIENKKTEENPELNISKVEEK